MRRLGGEYEESLSREMLETILKETVTGIAVVSPRVDGIQLDYTNDGFFTIFGYTRDEYEELTEDIIMNRLNPEDFMNIMTKLHTDYAPGDIQKFECRINRKNGETGWVLISTRKPHDAQQDDHTFVCNIVDITDTKKLQMQLQKEKERYEIVEEVSDNIIFNYDVNNDVFEASSKLLRSLGTNTKITNAIETFTYGNILDHRDVPAFIGALSSALSGKRINIFDARIINSRGDSIWHRIKFASVFDESGNAVRFIGMLSDIDKEKKEKNRLIAQAETDQLTGFLNKISTSLKISEMIRENQEGFGVMFLIDLDDFKKLNDTYGHREGDIFLKEFTNKLALSFRSTDVLGRVGGEEFVIYVSGAGDNVHYAKEKAEQIKSICHSIRLDCAPDKDFSCSIGIAAFPNDGETYTQLYEKADKAMYSVKKNGKDGYAFSDEE